MRQWFVGMYVGQRCSSFFTGEVSVNRSEESEDGVKVAFYAAVGSGDGTELCEMLCDAGYHATLEVEGEMSVMRESYAFGNQPRHEPQVLKVGVLRRHEVMDGIGIPDIDSGGYERWGCCLVGVESEDSALLMLLYSGKELRYEGFGIVDDFALHG